jgi:hypothetical protein
MLQLGEFDLEFSFFGAGALGKDVEDQRSPVEDFAVKNFLEVAALSGGKFVVENDGIHIGAPAMFGELVRLSLADEGGGARGGEFLHTITDDLSASGGCQFGKFLQ